MVRGRVNEPRTTWQAVIVSSVALLPGIVLMDGSRAALAGSVVPVRPRTPMMSVSFSSVQAIGLKMKVGL